MKELAYLNKYLLKYKKQMLLGLLFILISNAFQILPAQMVRHALNMVTENIALYRAFDGTANQQTYFGTFAKGILVFAILIIVMALLRGIFLYFVRQTLIVMSRLIEYDLKNEIFIHYQSLPLSFYRRNNTGDLLNRISEDVGRVRMYLGPSIMYGMQLFTLFIMIIPIMYAVSPMLTLYSLVPLPVLSFSIYYVHTIIEHRSTQIQRSQSRLSTFVQEAFSGIRVLKSFTRENESIGRFSNESNEYKRQSLKLTRVQSLFFPLVLALIGVSNILTIYAGSVEVINGSLTFGNVAEFVIYVNLLTWPVTLLGWTSSMVQRAEASQKRINEFLKEKSDIINGKIETIEGKIEFNNVSFRYPDTGIKALKNVSFSIDPGESLAIIGKTGSGKSTIACMVARLYDVTDGEIRIDGIPIRDFDITSLRVQLGYVPQDVFLFSDTIHNNIAFGLTGGDEEKIIKAAKDSDVYDNIMAFPKQFETRLGERGITLSGGQKQRVSIARAIVREPKILMLDDVLSAVDTKTENTILNSLKKIMKGRTTIIISHRVSSAKLANKIIVLGDGQIMEEGTHESLIERKGLYYELYEKQGQTEAIEVDEPDSSL
jgi:ATP-binding cassette, subfamily B, multidrug efflux pump